MSPEPLISSWMPRHDVGSAHHIDIRATPDVVYRAVVETDFSRNVMVQMLMAVRALPAFVVSPRKAWRRARRAGTGGTFAAARGLLGGAFALLEERPPTDLVFGLTGRFWTPSGGLVPSDPGTFRNPVPPGLARAAWSFQVQPLDDRTCRLATETRVLCGDPSTRRRFRAYWTIVRIGSGVIRWALLKQIRTVAERATSLLP